MVCMVDWSWCRAADGSVEFGCYVMCTEAGKKNIASVCLEQTQLWGVQIEPDKMDESVDNSTLN